MQARVAVIDATTCADGGAPENGWRRRYTTPVANVPLIGHVLDEVARGGIREARIIAAPEVRRELDRILGGRTWGLEISYVETRESDARVTLLSEISRALADGAVLVHAGDCLLRSQVSAMCDRVTVGDVDLVLPEQEAAGSGPRLPNGPASRGVTVLGPETRSIVAELLGAARGDQDLVEAVVQSGYRVARCAPGEYWCYSDSTASLLSANRMLLDALPVRAPEGSFEGLRMDGRVALSPDARVINSTLQGPVAIDHGAVIEDSFIGPYTAVGSRAQLRGAEIDNSMVLADAEISHAGYRIEGSIIAEGARVMRSFELPKGLHMRLGPRSHVTFS